MILIIRTSIKGLVLLETTIFWSHIPNIAMVSDVQVGSLVISVGRGILRSVCRTSQCSQVARALGLGRGRIGHIVYGIDSMVYGMEEMGYGIEYMA